MTGGCRPWPGSRRGDWLASSLLACLMLCCESAQHDGGGAIRLDGGFALADIVTETTEIRPATPDGRRHLLAGWRQRRLHGERVAMGVGQESSVWFFSASPQEIDLTLHGTRLQPVRTLTVLVNGSALETIPTVAEAQAYAVEVPAQVVRAGRNVLTVRYGHPSARTVPGHQPAMYWHALELERGQPAVVAVARASEGRLFIPFGTRLEYFLEVPPRACLELGRVRFSGGKGLLRADLAGDARPPRTLVEIDRAVGGERIPLDNPEREVVRLTLEALSESVETGGVVISSPRVLSGDAGPADRSPESAAAPDAGDPPRNVLLYVIDTLRADHLGMYGYERDVSPHLDRFAAGATLFVNAHAQSSWTRASMASILTGLWPGKHGATGRKDVLAQAATTLPELLRRAGYRTGAITANPMVSPTFGFEQGFDEHLTTENDDPLVLLPMLEDWLDRSDPGRPFFVWMHAFGPHDPYTPPAREVDRLLETAEVVDGLEQPPPAGEMSDHPPGDRRRAVRRWVDLYDGEIAQHDRAFQGLLASLTRRDLLATTLVIVVSDHGEEFLEHGDITHGHHLFDEVVRVPLVMRFPDRGHGRRVEQVVDHLDILPTIMDWIGVPPPPSVGGASLLELLDDPDGWLHKRYSFLHLRLDRVYQVAVVADRWKLIQDRALDDGAVRRSRLFDTELDPAELANVAWRYPIRARFMEKLLEARLVEGASWETREAVLDPETEASLRALGYLQ